MTGCEKVVNLKSDFRAIAKANLQSLNKEKERFRDKKINLLLKKIIQNELNSRTIRYNNSPKNLLLYIPLDLEVNIFPLIFHLKKQKNIKIFSPFVFQNGEFTDKGFKIVPFRLPLAKNKFNIYESKNSNFVNFNKIDLAIVPILGVDCAFRRIGFGKGMFDRFYIRLKNKPKTIFVSRSLHFSRTKISDFYDIKGDVLVATRGYKYDFYNNWIKRSSFCRPFIWHNKAFLHQRAQSLHRTSTNQS